MLFVCCNWASILRSYSGSSLQDFCESKMRTFTLVLGIAAIVRPVEGRWSLSKSEANPPQSPPLPQDGALKSFFNLNGGSTRTKSRQLSVTPSTKKNVIKPATDEKKIEAISKKDEKEVSSSVPPPPPHHFKNNKKDTVAKFAADIAYVLNVLRKDHYDPTVPKMFHSSQRPTFAVTWTHEMWDKHTSRWRFINQFLYWYKSALLQRILPQLSVLMIWCCLAIKLVEEPETTIVEHVKMPMTSLSLVSGFVGSLLALRSNQGLARLMEARQAFGKVVFHTRDLSSIIRHFVYSKEPELALKLARHLALYSWLLKNFLRGTKISGTDEDIIRAMLTSSADADYILCQRKKPVAVTMRLRQALHHLSESHQLTTAEEMAMDHTIQALDQSIMLTERIVASPIPPLFTTHAGRLLVFYLFFLPLALHKSGSMNRMGTFVTVLATGYAMLGLDEISHLMEQPFRLVPMYHLCKKTMRDVADNFCISPPSLDNSKNKRYEPAAPQSYWTNDLDQHDTFEVVETTMGKKAP